MNEIGNFFELETANLSLEWLNDRILLNSGRNALKYIVKAYNIMEIYVPFYTCRFVWDILKDEGCKVNFYHVNKDFLPIDKFRKSDYILYNNYFGICDKQIDLLKTSYNNLIIDNTQAFYSNQKCLASFFSVRKFFGVPDGGFAWCDKKIEDKLNIASSYHLCIHLLKAYDKGHDNSYINFLKNEVEIDKMPLQIMSNLTKSLLKNINYDNSRKIRLENFQILHNALGDKNELKFNLTENDVPMFYPYLTKNTMLWQKLKGNGIYLISCWPQIDEFLSNDELYLKENLIPLPLDQRYNKSDMQKILEIL